jgi:hypothetical protein
MSCQARIRTEEGFCPMAGHCPGGVCPMAKNMTSGRSTFIFLMSLLLLSSIFVFMYANKYMRLFVLVVCVSILAYIMSKRLNTVENFKKGGGGGEVRVIKSNFEDVIMKAQSPQVM